MLIAKKTIRRGIDLFVGLPSNLVTKLEYNRQVFIRYNERPVEFAFVFRHLGRIYPARVLDVGTGTTALPHLIRKCGFNVTATDNKRDYWPSGMVNRHYHVIDDDITKTKLGGKFDFISCVSVLEHIKDSDRAVANMFSLLNPGGYLAITFPYNEREYCDNVYALPESRYGKDVPYVTQAYARPNITRWREMNNATIIEQEYWKFWEGTFWNVGDDVLPPKQVEPEELHQHSCLLMQKNR